MPAIRGSLNAGASPATLTWLKVKTEDTCAANECERETRAADGQVSGNAISSVRRPIADQAAGGAARRLRRADARLDEHSPGARLYPHRRHADRHRTLHGSAAARRLR